MIVEGPALGGQPALALHLGNADVSEDRGVDGSTSDGWQSTRCFIATLYGGVYSYLGDVANNPGDNVRMEKIALKGLITTAPPPHCTSVA